MGNISGVKTEKNKNGELTSITINLKKHKNAIKPLSDLGLIKNEEISIFYNKVKNSKNTSIEEARRLSLNHIDSLPWSK
ncbi:MAG: hypothetical protein SFY32_06760 [Bacteroidota bacterium]|nr:hypothetical protein [Bacteroidota bacterium]